MEVTRTARQALANAYRAEGLDKIADWIVTGQADRSTHTPALTALTTAQAEADALRAEVEALRVDAERWRAFYGSERFYVMGAAGFDWDRSSVWEPRDETNWLHFTLNVWDRHPAHGDEQDVQGRAMLLSYVDHLRARAALDRQP